MLYLLFSPSSGLPKTSVFDIPHFDKLLHFGMFAFLTFLFLWETVEPNRSVKKKIVLYVLASLCFATASEFIQEYLISGRHGNVYDFLADFTGLIAGSTFYVLIGRKHLKHSKPISE
jgi:VanZ family protein